MKVSHIHDMNMKMKVSHVHMILILTTTITSRLYNSHVICYMRTQAQDSIITFIGIEVGA